MEKNIILVDWFAMSYRQKGITVYDVIESLGLKEDVKFMQMPGRYMYRDRLSFGNIHIYYNNINSEQDFPMLEMTGQGCREFETFSFFSFNDMMQLAKDTKKYHMTRLDIAYDDRTDILDIVCRNCWMCELWAYPRRACMWYLPYIFRRSPYREWFQEIEQLRRPKIDIFDFKG